MEQELKRYMDVEEVSAYLGISKWMIYKYVGNREIPFIPFGRLVRFDRMAVDKWAEKMTVRGFSRRDSRLSMLEFCEFEMPPDVLAEIEAEKRLAAL
jgi:excisionase family DNA binding protein